jgi:hypothetical protein
MTIWEAADALLERAPHWSDLRAHGVELIAARRWRARGRPVPPEVDRQEHLAAVRTLATPLVLERARAAYDGPIVVLKGPEVAARYPDPTLRPSVDLDLLVGDVEEAQRALLAAGFEPAGDPAWAFRQSPGNGDLFANKQHDRPLYWPGLPLGVELHRRPSWPRWLTPPRADRLLAAAVPGTTGVDGLLVLPPAEHAVVLAAHAWVHIPLGRLRDLLDVAATAAAAERRELDDVAGELGVERLWSATISAADSLLSGEPSPLALRLWARNLPALRERTVAEAHLERWISTFWTLPPGVAVRQSASNIAWDFRPAAQEPWRAKLARIRRAVRNAAARKSQHDRELGREARQLHPPERWAKRGSPERNARPGG